MDWNKMPGRWLQTSLGVLLGLVVLSGSARELTAPQQVIQSTSERLQKVLVEDRDRLRSDPAYVYRLANEILLPYVDFSRVSALVLGRYWKRATDMQKMEFSQQFQRLLVRTYATAFRELGRWRIEHLAPRMDQNGERVLVRTRVAYEDNRPLSVDYRMHYAAGAWKIYDVRIEGVSLVTNYRASFSRLARRKGMDGLIDELRDMNGQRRSAEADKLAAATEF